MSSRPYARKSSAELQAMFECAKTDEATLKRLANELERRHVPTARTLAKKVDEALRNLGSQGTQCKPEPRTPESDVPKVKSEAAEDRVIPCKGCASKLRVRLVEGVHRMRCPTCKTQFTTSFENDVLSVEFDPNRRANGAESARLTLEEAYRVFEAGENTPWEQIERVRRKLIQQYHPDKVAALGPKLREVAEAEGKRINRAFDLLRTARRLQ